MGHCWDNARTESFFGRRKCEVAPAEMFAARDHAPAVLCESRDLFDNRVRWYSSLGSYPPMSLNDGRTTKAASNFASIFVGEISLRSGRQPRPDIP